MLPYEESPTESLQLEDSLECQLRIESRSSGKITAPERRRNWLRETRDGLEGNL
jgi:hypothetical protein